MMRSAVMLPNAHFLHSILVAYRGVLLRSHTSLTCTSACVQRCHAPSKRHITQILSSYSHELSPHARTLLPCYRDGSVTQKSYFSSVESRWTLAEADRLPAGGWRLGAGRGWSSVRCLSSYSKKKRTPIVMGQKAKMEMVKLWKGMTIAELGAALGKDFDTTLEIMSFIKQAAPFRHRNAVVTDGAVLSQAARIAGKRPLFAGKPETDKSKKTNSKDAFRRPPADRSALVARPPVITIMGHVDHGKTTLLDALRHSNIVDSEFGGITQHIGAFQFSLPSGSPITVLDTPGHAAFSSMRGRGASVTDIVVLVVAADDGVMPQTKESIEHCKRANVPMVVALNKIDKPDADVIRARASLLQAGVQLEDQGGDVQCVEISAKKGTNLPALVEAVLTLAEILEVSADPKGLVEASVIEAKQLPVKGKVATCLVQRGTLRRGALLVAGACSCKVRAMYNEHEQEVQEAPPATPVQVVGWEELPGAGDEVLEVASRPRLKEVVAWRRQRLKEEKLLRDKVIVEAKAQEQRQKHRAFLEEKHRQGIRYKMRLNRTGMRPKETDDTDLGPSVSILLKCDVQGSLEAILQVLETYESESVRLDIVTSGVGPVTLGDVQLAETFGATIFAFNVGTERSAEAAESVSVVHTNIIYRLVEELRRLLSEQMPTLPHEEVLGEAEVLEQFMASDDGGRKKTPVAGCRCVKGTLKKDAMFRLYRDNDLVHEGPLLSMRHVKSEVGSVGTDKECGLKFEDRSIHFQKGDRIVCYTVHQLEQESDWRPKGF